MTSVFQAISRRFSISDDNIPTPTPSFTRPANDTLDATTYATPANDSNVETLHRRMSKSECLLLSKRSSKSELPSPCQEYISQIQTVMRRNSQVA
ncbi:hypothetical protein Ae201684P_002952 [Aphanomyces euteiches]|uniref:Uncharacterized protein n=1 Tax=Aphanomyces euteiches TaxID=100861 RepID=A0A6G0X1Q9_9STRA|nr:hypothetical protein Ae201684_009310 [Aphanomyces euteiches]KAH9070595.1 hypothetical protein Ae201684P_002952 [Aphanomyces euteiches]